MVMKSLSSQHKRARYHKETIYQTSSSIGVVVVGGDCDCDVSMGMGLLMDGAVRTETQKMMMDDGNIIEKIGGGKQNPISKTRNKKVT